MAKKIQIRELTIEGTDIRLEFESVGASSSVPSCVKIFQGNQLLATIEANLDLGLGADRAVSITA